jgi:hypothetical protein
LPILIFRPGEASFYRATAVVYHDSRARCRARVQRVFALRITCMALFRASYFVTGRRSFACPPCGRSRAYHRHSRLPSSPGHRMRTFQSSRVLALACSAWTLRPRRCRLPSDTRERSAFWALRAGALVSGCGHCPFGQVLASSRRTLALSNRCPIHDHLSTISYGRFVRAIRALPTF